jgi:hypothetical protein
MYGIYLSILFPFRIAHPTLFIPWEDVSVKGERRRWLSPRVELRFAKCPFVPFLISRKLAAKLSQASGARLDMAAAVSVRPL